MKKIVRHISLIFIMACILTATVFGKPITLNLDGKPILLKNPPIILDGTTYLPAELYTKYLGFTQYKTFASYERQDCALWLGEKKGDYEGYQQINWRKDPTFPWVKKINNTYYIPAKAVAPYVNYEMTYDSKKQLLSITNNGILSAEDIHLSTEQYVTVSGYVYDESGSPVESAKVLLTPQRANGAMGAIDEKVFGVNKPFEVLTDVNGYYEVPNIDSKKIPCIYVSAIKTINGKEFEAERTGGLHSTLIDEILQVKSVKMGALRYVTAQEKLPPIYLLPKIYWDELN